MVELEQGAKVSIPAELLPSIILGYLNVVYGLIHAELQQLADKKQVTPAMVIYNI